VCHACRLGLEGIVTLRPVTALGEEQEPKAPGGEAGGGGGLEGRVRYRRCRNGPCSERAVR
jgi:hypothetical protein